MDHEIKAQITPFSSVVGQSVLLTDETGAALAQLSISIPDPRKPYQETAEEIARVIELAINQPPSEEIKRLRVRLGDLMIEDAKRMAALATPASSPAGGVREALLLVRPVIAGLIDAEYNVETWGLKGRLAAINAALSESRVCEVCGGDCSAANPPPSYCPTRDAALSAPAPAPESAPAPADGEAVPVGYARRDDIEAITERDEVLLWGTDFPGSVALYATPPAARSEPAAEMVEKAAREIFNRRHPHEGWDQFDERKEARGGNLHPFQEEAIEDARIALRALPPEAPGAQDETA